MCLHFFPKFSVWHYSLRWTQSYFLKSGVISSLHYLFSIYSSPHSSSSKPRKVQPHKWLQEDPSWETDSFSFLRSFLPTLEPKFHCYVHSGPLPSHLKLVHSQVILISFIWCLVLRSLSCFYPYSSFLGKSGYICITFTLDMNEETSI